MGSSFIASLFQGFGTPFDTTESGGGTGGATYSYVWNTIRLLLGLLVETGRNFGQWFDPTHQFPFVIPFMTVVI